MKKLSLSAVAILVVFLLLVPAFSENKSSDQLLDEKVKEFLSEHKYSWHDLNIPEEDGRKLYDLIIQGNYKKALEIGTSTGHSSIWIAWALSKTGGKLITIEIDEQRYRTALKNFKEAGLSEYVDARLADAHELVKKLKGPFDFVFCDADKEWYKNYFTALESKIKIGGCYTAHNVTGKQWGRRSMGTSEYARYITSLNEYDTTFFLKGSGLAISYKLE